MTMNRSVALLIAACTLAPWVFFVALFAHFASQFEMNPTTAVTPEQFFDEFGLMFRLQFAAMAWSLALLALYITHLFKTQRVPADKKALWGVVLFFGSILAMPVYWYFYMWPSRAQEGA